MTIVQNKKFTSKNILLTLDVALPFTSQTTLLARAQLLKLTSYAFLTTSGPSTTNPSTRVLLMFQNKVTVYSSNFLKIADCTPLTIAPIYDDIETELLVFLHLSLTVDSEVNFSENLRDVFKNFAALDLGPIPKDFTTFTMTTYYSGSKINFKIEDALIELGVDVKSGEPSSMLTGHLENIEKNVNYSSSVLEDAKSPEYQQLSLEALEHNLLRNKVSSQHKAIDSKHFFLMEYVNFLCSSNSPVDYKSSSIESRSDTFFNCFEKYKIFQAKTTLDSKKKTFEPRYEEFLSLSKFIIGKELISWNEESLGLLLISSFTKILFNTYTNEIKKIVEDDEAISSIELNIREDSLYKNVENFSFKETRFKEDLYRIISQEYENFLRINKAKFDTVWKSKITGLIETLISSANKEYQDKLKSHYSKLDVLDRFCFSAEDSRTLPDMMLGLLADLTIFERKLLPAPVRKKNKFQYHEVSFLVFNTDFLKELFKTQVVSIPTPMVCKPNPWDENLQSGGFLSNAELRNRPGIKLKNFEHDKADIPEMTREYLNALQETKYRVDEEFLDVVRARFPYLMSAFVGCGTKDSESVFQFIKNGALLPDGHRLSIEDMDLTAKLKSWEQFKSDYYSSEGKSKTKKRLFFIYLKKCQKFANFVSIFFLADVYKGRDLYFPADFCFRWRKYQVSGCLSPQGCRFSKSLLNMSGTAGFKKSERPHNKYVDSQVEDWRKTGGADSSKIFQIVKYDAGIACSYVEGDVSASGVQIFSGCVGSAKGLILSNLLRRKDDANTKKLDPYTSFMDKFEESFDNFFESNPNFQDPNSYDRMFLGMIKKVFRSRSFSKDLIMTFMYSQGPEKRAKKIEKTLIPLKNPDYLAAKDALVIKTNSVEANKIEYKLIMAVSDKFFSEVFGSLFKEIHAAKDFLENRFIRDSSIPTNKGIFLSCGIPDAPTTFYSIFEQKTVRFVRYHRGTQRSTTKSMPDENSFDIKKAKQSICPNFIHYLDGALCRSVILKCKENGISLATAHDAFSCCYLNVEKVKQFYFDSYIEIVFNRAAGNPLINFIKANKDINSFTTKEVAFMKRVEKDWEQLISELSELYVMSPNVLTP